MVVPPSSLAEQTQNCETTVTTVKKKKNQDNYSISI